jgi:large conductance mechanosensitive channel
MGKREKKSRKKEKRVDGIEEVIDATRNAGKKVDKKTKAFWADFKKFVAKGNVVDLAIAVVVGTAFNKIVSALVSEIINPLTSLLLKEDTLIEQKWVLRAADEANEIPEIAVTYGVFLQRVIDFMVVALSIYVTLKIFIKLKNTIRRREIEAAEQRAREEAARKKAEAEEKAAKEAEIRQNFINDVAAQADLLTDIKEILSRIEKNQAQK